MEWMESNNAAQAIMRRIEKENAADTIWIVLEPSSTGAPGEGEDADVLFLVNTNSTAHYRSIKNYSAEGQRIQERWISQQEIENALATGHPQRLVQWVERGGIHMDVESVGEKLRDNWKTFPGKYRSQQLLTEFSQVVQKFHATKRFMDTGYTLDAFSCMLNTMVHWARIVIIEKGMHPEILVWEQVRHYNVGVYKLYEELLTSSETIDQRVKLVLLAAEFSMMSKMKNSCELLLNVLASREEPWSIDEIANHEDLVTIQADWSLLLTRLAKRNMVREVNVFLTDDVEITETRYLKGA